MPSKNPRLGPETRNEVHSKRSGRASAHQPRWLPQAAMAEPLCQRALVIFSRAVGVSHPDLAWMLDNHPGLLREMTAMTRQKNWKPTPRPIAPKRTPSSTGASQSLSGGA
jgi:hypothetical protein